MTSHFLIDCNASPTGSGGAANNSCSPTSDYSLSGYGSNVFDRLRAYQNFFMLIGGHRFGESYIALDRSAEGFNPVHAVLANYQHLQYSATEFEEVSVPGPSLGSSGYFELMRFDMDRLTVDLDSLSPALAAMSQINGSGSILSVQSNAARPTTVFGTRDIDPTVPANLVDGGGNPTLYTQSVSNLVNISFAGYVIIGGGGSPASYDGAVSGDLVINGTQSINLGVGANTISGTVTWSNATGISTDFDAIALIVPAGSSIASVTIDMTHQSVGSGLWSNNGWAIRNNALGVNLNQNLAIPAPGAAISVPMFAAGLPLATGTYQLRSESYSGALAFGDWRRGSYTVTANVTSP